MLYSSTKIVEGYKNVCIQNTNENKFLNYPLDKYFQFKNSLEFKNYLSENHFSFNISHYDSFTEKNRSFEESFQIPFTYQSIIIEGEPILNNLRQLLENGVSFHTIGIKDNVSIKWITELSEIVLNSCVNNIVFSYEYQQTLENQICSILSSCYCSFNSNNNNTHIIFINNELFYNESHLYNPYYNSKLLLTADGFLLDSVVNGKKLNLKNSESKNIIWYSSKSKIDVCRDCEFRHMCLDKRIPMDRSTGEWFYIQECNYNPYIAKWKGEEGYRTLEECGVISNEKEFSKDRDKIAAINEELWVESV